MSCTLQSWLHAATQPAVVAKMCQVAACERWWPCFVIWCRAMLCSPALLLFLATTAGSDVPCILGPDRVMGPMHHCFERELQWFSTCWLCNCYSMPVYTRSQCIACRGLDMFMSRRFRQSRASASVGGKRSVGNNLRDSVPGV